MTINFIEFQNNDAWCSSQVLHKLFHIQSQNDVTRMTKLMTSRLSRQNGICRVSAHGRTNIHLIEPGVKVNGQYYRDVLLKQGLLPDIRDITDEYFIFQQDSAPAHRARDTVALLETETPDFIPPTLWPPNSPALNPVDYNIWSVMQEKVYRSRICDVSELRSRIVEAWDEMDPVSYTHLTLPTSDLV